MGKILSGLALLSLAGCNAIADNKMDLQVVFGILIFSLTVPVLALIYVFFRMRRRAKVAREQQQ